MNSFNLPAGIESLIETLEAKGYSTWVVGGALRNHLLNKPITDWDLATQATPEQMLEIWPDAIDIGRDFGAMGKSTAEGLVQITTLRTESIYKNHRRPHHVVFTNSIEEDLQRRDFTVNAMAYRLMTKEFFDPSNGKQDIESLRLKSVGEANLRIQEDALRILRAFRFIAQYGFTLEPSLKKAIQTHQSLLSEISKERIARELHPLLLGAHAQKSIKAMQSLGLYPYIFHASQAEDFCLDALPKNLPLRCWYLLAQTQDLNPDHLLPLHLDREDQQTVTKLIDLGQSPLKAKQKLLWLAWAKRLNIHDLITTLSLLGLQNIASWLQTFSDQGYDELFYRFPVQGKALMKHLNLEQGRAIGQKLTQLKEYYVDHPEKIAGKSIDTLIQYWYNAS